MSSEAQQQHNPTGKCLCPYCSGSIARGMQKLNDENVELARKFVEKISTGEEKNLRKIDEILDTLNPIQCFDIFDELCRLSRSNEIENDLNDLIVKFVERFRDNGGFFIALRQPEERRKVFLERLEKSILINENFRQRLRLNPSDLFL